MTHNDSANSGSSMSVDGRHSADDRGGEPVSCLMSTLAAGVSPQYITLFYVRTSGILHNTMTNAIPLRTPICMELQSSSSAVSAAATATATATVTATASEELQCHTRNNTSIPMTDACLEVPLIEHPDGRLCISVTELEKAAGVNGPK